MPTVVQPQGQLHLIREFRKQGTEWPAPSFARDIVVRIVVETHPQPFIPLGIVGPEGLLPGPLRPR